MNRKYLFILFGIALLAIAFAAYWPATAASVTPILVSDNPGCQDLGYDYGFKIDPPASGTYIIDQFNTVTVTTDGVYFDWTSTLGMDAVIAKGGDNANVYVYDPPKESFGDTGLHSPENASGDPAGLSHIDFCFDYEVTVTKTANTSFTRTYDWTIEKSVGPDTWDLFKGDSGISEYTVKVTKTGYTDSDWAVSGKITIENKTPFDATITGVSDTISGFGGTVTVTCGKPFPYILASGGTLECTYSTALPDGTNRTNTATVTTSGDVGGDEGTADVTFSEPTKEVNDEITVKDYFDGATTGELVGSAKDTKTFNYDRTFNCPTDESKYTDGKYTHSFTNTAKIEEITDKKASANVDLTCYLLSVTKDASTSLTRTWTWTIDKSADQTDLTLALGEQFLVNYEVKVDATSSDSEWAVTGKISVHNPAQIDAIINGVSDVVSPSIAAIVDCGVSFPYTLAAGGDLNCTYSTDLPDATSRTNTATATLQNYDYDKDEKAIPNGTTDFSGTASVNFSDPTINKVDDCINVNDSYGGDLGKVCVGVDTLPKTLTYSRTIGPYSECGNNTIKNTASFKTDETGTMGSSSWTITVNVPCQGCTLTPGYWKTHSEYGPAPYDDTWALLPNGADTQFFLSGQSYYEVLWTAPRGNAYYILAHAYIAAKLNTLNGASTTPEVNAAIAWAEDFFASHEPGDKLSKSDRQDALYYATILDDYNNGLTGPGHCSEDSITSFFSRFSDFYVFVPVLIKP